MKVTNPQAKLKYLVSIETVTSKTTIGFVIAGTSGTQSRRLRKLLWVALLCSQ
jgi:hypothetical protein